MSNEIDRDIGRFDNKIDMTGMESLDDTNVDDIRPQVGHFVSPDDPGVNALASGRPSNIQHHQLGPHGGRCERMETVDTMSTRST